MSKHKNTSLYDCPDVLSVKEVSHLIHVCEKTVYKLIREKTIFSIRIGNSFRVPKHAILSYLGVLSEEYSLEHFTENTT